MFQEIYKNKTVLVTGNTGFKGSWLSAWLLELGANVVGLSDCIPTEPSHFEAARLRDKIKYFEADIQNYDAVFSVIKEAQPDFVFHLAAQALVRYSYQEPLQTLQTNMMGTAHILESLRQLNHPCHAVMITSDKCYDNVEWTWGYRENDALGGKDPYSASKGGAELVIKTYAHSYFGNEESSLTIASGRAGNVIGGGDWAEDRIVPDCVRAWAKEQSVEIRNPFATRPWQHVLEPLSGYLTLGAVLAQTPKLNGESFNFGPPANQNHSVQELIEAMADYWEEVRYEHKSVKNPVYEAGLLKLCCDKALHHLQWNPVLNFKETVRFTAEWYRHFYQDSEADIFSVTQKQIQNYTQFAQERGLAWSKT